MPDSMFFENKKNWQCTFVNGNGAMQCLMRNLKGGYFFVTANYEGFFAWGATSTFNANNVRDAVKRGKMVLVKGQMPAELAK